MEVLVAGGGDMIGGMAKVVMGIGLPGAGKSTLLKEFAGKNGYRYICPDDIREELSGDAGDQSVNQRVWDLARERLAAALKGEETAVFDATFAIAEQRKQFLEFARRQGAEKIQGIFIDPPFEVAQKRNLGRPRQVSEHAMRRMEGNLSSFPPDVADGLDSLFTLLGAFGTGFRTDSLKEAPASQAGESSLWMKI